MIKFWWWFFSTQINLSKMAFPLKTPKIQIGVTGHILQIWLTFISFKVVEMVLLSKISSPCSVHILRLPWPGLLSLPDYPKDKTPPVFANRFCWNQWQSFWRYESMRTSDPQWSYSMFYKFFCILQDLYCPTSWRFFHQCVEILKVLPSRQVFSWCKVLQRIKRQFRSFDLYLELKILVPS